MRGEMQHESDLLLWDAIRKDNDTAFRILFDRYWSKLYATCFYHLHDKEACSEIVHDIFLQLWLKRHQLEITSFQHYVTTAARYNVYKRFQQRDKQVLYLDTLHSESAIQNEGEENLRFKELNSSVEGHLQELPERCREIFHLSRREHFSISEIAERLGISKRTVENQITRALQHLRHTMGDMYIFALISYTLLHL
jgi:RNA polymerase sigma-70 factor (family 1)